MKIAVIGAGYVGSKIIIEAINRKMDVTVLTRNQPKNLGNEKSYKWVQCDAEDVKSLKSHLKGIDVVIHAYGAPTRTESIEVCVEKASKVTNNIIEASLHNHVKRIVAVGGAGTLKLNGARMMDQSTFPPEYVPAAKAIEAVYNILLSQKKVDATVLCPPLNLFEGERCGTFRIGKDDIMFNEKNENSISTSDFAIAIIDEVTQPKHINQRFTVAY